MPILYLHVQGMHFGDISARNYCCPLVWIGGAYAVWEKYYVTLLSRTRGSGSQGADGRAADVPKSLLDQGILWDHLCH